MNQEILKRLRLFNNSEAVKTFFSLLKEFVETLKLSALNEKLSLNIRNDYRKRISVNLNGRLVLALQGDETSLEFLFMINDEDIETIQSAFNINQRDELKDIGTRSYQIAISSQYILQQDIKPLIEAWLKSSKLYEPTQNKSQYRKYHIHELYDIAFNNRLLDEYLSVVQQVSPDITIWKLGCNWGEDAPDFYDYIRENNIVITHEDYLFSKGDLVLITRGFRAYAIAKVLETPRAVITNIELEKPFSINDIDYNEYVFFAISEWLELTKGTQFEYQLRKGIRKIQQPEVRKRVLSLWNSRFEDIGAEKENNMRNINSPLNQILFGPPGTGKTYRTIDMAVNVAAPDEYQKDNHKNNKRIFDKLVSIGQIVFTTFHQSMSYEDFVEGIKPQSDGSDVIKYDIENGLFKEFCTIAKANYENSKKSNTGKIPFEAAFEMLKNDWYENADIQFSLRTEGYEFTITDFTKSSIRFRKASGGTSHTLSINTLKEIYYGTREFKNGLGRYYDGVLNKLSEYKTDNITTDEKLKKHVFIVDEINRGNVSQIFGELITLIEADKRLGNKESLEVTLPYSKEKFGVPPNLYIIGTMNTADRSVEALDTALRRRFSFIEMPPVYDLNELNNIVDSEIGLSCGELLQIINNRIEKLLDKDHLIGHSYFMGVNEWVELKAVFQNNIIPLLQEYFFGDSGKIGLVLGSGFFENNGKPMGDVDFAKFDNYNGGDFEQREVYRLKDVSKMDEETFIYAIKILLNRQIEQK